MVATSAIGQCIFPFLGFSISSFVHLDSFAYNLRDSSLSSFNCPGPLVCIYTTDVSILAAKSYRPRSTWSRASRLLPKRVVAHGSRRWCHVRYSYMETCLVNTGKHYLGSLIKL
jgi:hypothetical protein